MCNALEELAEGEFEDHIDLSGCKNKFDINDDDDVEDTEAENWRPINKGKAVQYIRNIARQSKRLCHNHANLKDDFCKNKVECITVEGLAVTYPNLVKTKDCKRSDLKQISHKVVRKSFCFFFCVFFQVFDFGFALTRCRHT